MRGRVLVLLLLMATAIFCCGFECGQIGAVGQHWRAGVGTPIIVSGNPPIRSGNRALECAAVGTALYARRAFTGTRLIARQYVHFIGGLPSADCPILSVDDTNGPQVRFQQSDGKLYAAVGTTLGASGVSVSADVWIRIDFDFNINTGGNDLCDVQVNGTACGQATAAGISAAPAFIHAGVLANITQTIRFDDVIWSATAADYPFGGGYVHPFICTADGTHNIAGAADFRRGTTTTDILNSTTDACLLLDEVPLDDTTPDTDDFISLFGPPNAGDYTEHVIGPAPGMPVPTVGPRTVEAIIAIHQAGTGTGNMRVRLNDNGTEENIYSATAVAGTTTIIYKTAHFDNAPTGVAWNAAGDGGNGDFRDLRVRFGSPAAVDANPDQYLDGVMLEAEFIDMLRDRAIFPDPVIHRGVVGY